jgi:hypothetical protein
VVAAVGIAYVTLIGWRLIPVERTAASMPSSIEDLESYLVELRVPAEAEVIGQKLRQLDSQGRRGRRADFRLVRTVSVYQAWRPAPPYKLRTGLSSRADPMVSRLLRAQWR